MRKIEERDWSWWEWELFHWFSLAELETREGIGLVGLQEVMAVVMASMWKEAGRVFWRGKLIRIQEL